jgi:hypothetical protein
VLGLREDACPRLQKRGGVLNGLGHGLCLSADWLHYVGAVYTYAHVVLGLLQALDDALNDLVDIAHALQLLSQCSFSGLLGGVVRLLSARLARRCTLASIGPLLLRPLLVLARGRGVKEGVRVRVGEVEVVHVGWLHHDAWVGSFQEVLCCTPPN